MVIRRAAVLCFLGCLAASAFTQPSIVVRDAFGRDVARRGIVLLDWDGFMANPAVKLTVEAPNETSFPVRFTVASDCRRLMFERASDDRRGLGTRISQLQAHSPAVTWVSIFPDRDGKDEDHKLYVSIAGSRDAVEIPVHVVDQDRPFSPLFKITLDYSQDRTGFFREARAKAILRQAADDWSFFIDDMRLDPVRAHEEKTEVWNPDGFVSTRTATNKDAYTGYLMYMVGIAGRELRSGGSPSHEGRRQSSDGKPLPLLRSGSVDVETRGNYHRLGWFFDSDEEDWWCSGDLADEPADFYSIMLHEMGHALAFEPTYPAAAAARRANRWSDPVVQAYLGKDPDYDPSNHFAGSVDPASKFGVFGAEYQAQMRVRRWLITKAHLLLLQSAGYKIRRVSCFDPLRVAAREAGKPLAFQVGKPAQWEPVPSGGIPTYRWEVVSGALPPGLSVDTFSGAISGTPLSPGAFECVIRVTDQSPQPMTAEIRIAGQIGA